MTLFRKAAKPVCEELVTVTTTEVSKRIDDSAEGLGDILEVGILAVALIATIVAPHAAPVVGAAAKTVLCLPEGMKLISM